MDKGQIFPTKRDYWYGVGIVTLILSFLLAHAFSKSPSLASDLSVAATLISIIIGVLAIFISLYQSLTDQKASDNLHLSSNRIVIATDQLDKASTAISELASNLQSIDFRKHFTDLKEDTSELRKLFSTGQPENATRTNHTFLTDAAITQLAENLFTERNERLVQALYVAHRLSTETDVALDDIIDITANFLRDHILTEHKKVDLWITDVLGQMRVLLALSLIDRKTLALTNSLWNNIKHRYDEVFFTEANRFIAENTQT